MAIAFVRATPEGRTGSGGTPVTASFSALPAAGNLIIVYVWGWKGSTWTISTPTDNQSNTYHLAASKIVASNIGCAVYYAFNIGSPSGTFTVSVAHTATSLSIGAAEYSGATTTDPLDKTATNSGSSLSPSSGATATLSQADELAAGVATGGNANTITWTEPTGFTSRVQETDNINFQAGDGADKVLASTAAVTATWTMSGSAGAWAALVATFKAAVAATVPSIAALGEPSQPVFETLRAVGY